MIKKTWALVTILSIGFGCNTRTENTSDAANEVADVVVKAIRFKTQSVGGVSHSEIDAIAKFTPQLRIADLKRQIARVWTEVVQLFHRGCSVRMGVVRDDGATSPRRNAYTHSAG